MRVIICESCPCRNSDYENGSDCNLGYNCWLSSFNVDGKRESYYYSDDCKLCVVSYGENKSFTPQWVELEEWVDPPRKKLETDDTYSNFLKSIWKQKLIDLCITGKDK